MLAVGSGAIIILLVAFLVVTLSSGTGGVVACKEGYVRSSFTQKCIRAGDPNFGETRSGEREHTPAEEEAHNKSLETQRRGEEQTTEAQKRWKKTKLGAGNIRFAGSRKRSATNRARLPKNVKALSKRHPRKNVLKLKIEPSNDRAKKKAASGSLPPQGVRPAAVSNDQGEELERTGRSGA
jgi:hypothetical protein